MSAADYSKNERVHFIAGVPGWVLNRVVAKILRSSELGSTYAAALGGPEGNIGLLSDRVRHE
jgi:hypothetical protein